MDIQAAATSLINYLGEDPSRIERFANHPYSTTAKATGTDETISQKDMSRIITQVAAQASGQELGKSDTKSLASAPMGQSGGSAHNLASMLFGGGSQSSGSSSAGGFDLGSLLGALTGGSSSGSSAGPSMAEIAAKTIAGTVASQGLAALIKGAMGGNK